MGMSSNPLGEMRERLLAMKASELGLSPSNSLPNVWGLLFETGYPEGPVTLLTLAEGTTSLYLPTGGGVIGAGEHIPVRVAGEALLKTTEFALPEFSGKDHSAPPNGVVSFVALTHSGVVCSRALEQSLGNGRAPLSALFFAGQALLSQVRIASDQSEG